MNVAFGIRPDYLTNKGGDTYQMLKTKEYLEKYDDVHVRIVGDPEKLPADLDVLHIFNMQNPAFTYALLEKAGKRTKTVLSPIVWRFGDAEFVNKAMRLTHSMKFVRTFKACSAFFEMYNSSRDKKLKESILKRADAVLPNSDEEGEILRDRYRVDFREFVIPNCIDTNLFSSKPGREIPGGFVLQVGRIEPTKNQLSVVEAMMNHKEIPLVFIGKQNKIKQYYVDKTKELAAARGNTYFIEEMSQEELCAYYKAAKVHVLPSFRESPGLVSLEALYHGCNIVVSNRRYCPTDYYRFDKIAYTCDPYSITSIEKAIIDAYNSAFVPVESGYFDFFSYANAAKLTRDAYVEVLR